MALAKVIWFLAVCGLSARVGGVQFGEPLKTNILRTPNDEEYRKNKPLYQATLLGFNEGEEYFVRINVTDFPIFVPITDPPAEGETRIPDNDYIESVQIYLANEEGRILEIRFNRFQQSLVRLWRNPYSVLKDDISATFESAVLANDKYSIALRIPAGLMPAQVTRVNTVIINPTKEGGSKYLGFYRLYNHPFAYDWSMRVVKLYQPIDLYALAPENVNQNYSSWWNGL